MQLYYFRKLLEYTLRYTFFKHLKKFIVLFTIATFSSGAKLSLKVAI